MTTEVQVQEILNTHTCAILNYSSIWTIKNAYSSLHKIVFTALPV